MAEIQILFFKKKESRAASKFLTTAKEENIRISEEYLSVVIDRKASLEGTI
jgi:hypothetical protein